MVCIIATAYTAQAQCPSGSVNLLAQDSTDYANGTFNYIANNATLTCNAPAFYVYVDKNNMTTTGDISTPCILSQYNVGFFDGSFCSNATETFYEGTTDLLCVGTSTTCVYPIGGPGNCPGFIGMWGINKIYLDPSQQHTFQFCDNSILNISTTVQLQDCWTRAPLSSQTSFSVISLGNPCFTDTVPANTPIGTASFSITPVSGTVALTDYHNGKVFINPALLSGGTTYTLTYTFIPPHACPPLTGTFKFTLASSPPITINSATICAGSSATLTASGASTYTWNTSATGATITTSPTVTTTYTVTGTTGTCSSTKTTSVLVNATPTITANATATVVCAGTSVTLTGGGASTYTWTSGVSNGVPFVPASTQTYTVTGTDVNGCSNSATKTITVNPLPTVTANATATIVCAGGSVTLTGGGASTYTWTGGVSNGVPFVPASTQTYTVTGTNVNGCSNSATKTITVNPQPTASNAGPNQTICASTTTALSANTPTVGTGAWSVVSGGGIITVTNSPTSGVTNLSAGLNIFMWTISNGVCPSSTSTVSVNVNPTPSASNAGPNQTICASTTTALSANTPTVGTGAWSVVSGGGIITTTNSPTSGVTNLSTGLNIFMWSISNGVCPSSTSTVSVYVDVMPTIANAGPDILVYNPSVNTNANTPLIGTGVWSVISGNGTFLNSTNPITQVANLQFGQNIFMWTISNGSCPASHDEVIITLNELTIPNGFSPNGDDANDYFEIPGLTLYNNVKLDVFNRWGNLVFQNNDYKNDWGGKNNGGEDLTDDTYYFTLEITGKKTYKGYIVLKRK